MFVNSIKSLCNVKVVLAERKGANIWWHSLKMHQDWVEHVFVEIKLAQLVNVYVDTTIDLCLIATVEVVSEQI